MTNTTIKTNIQNNLVLKTVPSSISNVEIADILDSLVDYTDAQSVTKVAKTIITQAQILTLFSVPVKILGSTPAGKVRVPINVYIKRLNGVGYTMANNVLQIKDTLGNIISPNINANPLINTLGAWIATLALNGSITGGDLSASEYFLNTPVANPTGGSGNIEVYLTYAEYTFLV